MLKQSDVHVEAIKTRKPVTWLGLSCTHSAISVFEKANHTWATRVLWEKLHMRCRHECKHWNKAISVQQIPQNPPHSYTLTLNAECGWAAKFLSSTMSLREAKWDKCILILLFRGRNVPNICQFCHNFSAFWKSKEITSIEITWTQTVTNRSARSTEGHATMSTSGCKWRLRMSGWQEKFGSI